MSWVVTVVSFDAVARWNVGKDEPMMVDDLFAYPSKAKAKSAGFRVAQRMADYVARETGQPATVYGSAVDGWSVNTTGSALVWYQIDVGELEW